MRTRSTRRTNRFPGTAPWLWGLLLACLLPAAPLRAQSLAETYFIPLDEAHIFALATGVNSNDLGDTTAPNPDTIHTVISISTGASATTIFYDHWEDGYEVDLANPVQATTETLNLGAGTFTVLENDIFISPRDPAVIRYDGRDRMGSSELIAVTRAGWRLQEATLLAGAVEVFATANWGTSFEVPVGEDVTGQQMYEYTSVSVMAGDLGASVQVDGDADGTAEISLVLGPGETALIPGIQTGATLLSSDVIEVYLLTGDRGSNYEARWYSLVPLEQWDSSYYNPVGTAVSGLDTVTTLYNPGAADITVTYEVLQPTVSTFTYDQTTAGGIPDNTCPATGLTRTFSVTDNVTISDVDLGFNATHTYRGDIQLILTSPAGTAVTAIAINGGDGNNNYDLLLDDSAGGAINDGGADNVASPFYDRSAGPSNALSAFVGENSLGTWTLTMCDDFGGDVGTFNRARLVLEAITGSTPTTGTVNVPAGGTTEFTMPLDSGGHFFTAGGETFFALTAVDFDNTAHDWGFPLLPEENLTTTLLVGWAPGRDPTSTTNPTENGSPVWIIATADTTIYVDYDGDPSTGPLVDPNGDRYDEARVVTALQSSRIFDPNDGDQSGMRLYTIDGTLLTAAWGQDPATASPAAPALDLGTTVVPIAQVRLAKEGILFDDVDGDGGVDEGDTLIYTIAVRNVSNTVIADVVVEDIGLDVNVTYVADSTQVRGLGIADDGAPATAFPLDEGGIQIGPLALDETVLITFLVTVNTPFPVGVDEISNTVQVRTTTETETDSTTVPVGDPDLAITKVSDATGDVVAGQTLTYTVTVTNGSTEQQNGLKVLDALPVGTAYVPESTSVSGFSASTTTFTYEDTTAGAVGAGTPCGTPLVRNLVVGDTFTVSDASFGFNGSHPYRGDFQVTLESPAGTRVVVLEDNGADSNNDYDILLDDSAPGSINDGDADDTSAPFYDRDVTSSNPLAAFNGEAANGTWRVEICDTFSGADDGTYNRSQLVLLSSAINATTKTNQALAVSPLVDGEPNNLVLAPDGFLLQPAQSMTITYQVTVSDPLDINATAITNTAFARSIENPFPVVATVVDPVTRGGVIGDRVWLDADGDGVQDVGEPGIANVTVELFDPGPDGQPGGGDDVLVATTLTDANGNYLFDHLNAGDYFVEVDETTLPGGLTTSPGTSNPSSVVTITAEEEILDVDFGYRNADPNTAILGDFVWSDADADGIQDPGEVGVGGVTMNLLDGTGAVVATTTTASDGSYLFTGVAPGEYRVEVAAGELGAGGDLDGYSATSGPQSEGGARSAPVTVVGGDFVLDVDFGFSNPAGTYSISDEFWIDLDADGARDADEEPIPGVTVNLLDGAGDIIATAVTAPDGSFSFDGVPAGSYTLSVSDNGGRLVGLGGTTDPARNRSLAVTVTSSDVSGVNFGFNAPASLGDRLWSDSDGDGVQDGGELGLPGVTVELLDRGGAVIATAVTGADGSYLFEGLAPELYTVRVDATTLPAGYSLTGDPDATADGQSSVTLAHGESDLSLDFGYRNATLPELSGTVFNDLDRDGLEEAGESGFAGVSVELRDAADNVVATAFTDGSGNYTFSDLPNGDYTVAVTDVNGVLNNYELTSGLDVLPVTMAGTDVSDVDFGYARESATGSIGDALWLDSDRDGLEGPGEPGLSGVTVELYDPGPDGAVGGGDDTLLTSTVTDAAGGYLFAGLAAGDYFVQVDATTLPAGLAETTYPVGTDPSAVILLSDAEAFADADFGYIPASGSAVGDQVWYDADGDGAQDPGEVGIGGVEVTVTGPSGTFVVTTAADGSWLVPGLDPGAYFATVNPATLPAGYDPNPTNADLSYSLTIEAGTDYYYLDWGFNGGTTGSIGDTVFFDADGDGSQDPGENGIQGVTLNLLDGGGNILATVTTDGDGEYDFTGVPAGSYTVEVSDIGGVLAGLNLSSPAVGTISLAAGQDFDLADYGYAPSGGAGSIGSLVWHDIDGSGARDLGEDGIQGVTVDLWIDVDGDGSITPGVDNFLRTATTDGNGEYEFTGLAPGDYLVDVTDTAGVLAGFSLTDGVDGVNNNSQVDPYALTLTAASPSDDTADFGFQAAVANDIGGTVFKDLDRDGLHDEPGEDTVAGMTVNLYRVVAGTPVFVGSTFTDGSGDYLFQGLPDGDYRVEVNPAGTEVDGFLQTTQTTSGGLQPVTLAGADSLDNDFGFFDGGITTTPVTLASFEARGNGTVEFRWATATEVGNLGFYLWVATSEGWIRVQEELIPSKVVDSLSPQSYRRVVSGVDGEYFLLEDVDTRGRSNFHGPFEVGRRHGAPSVEARSIDWASIGLAARSAAFGGPGTEPGDPGEEKPGDGKGPGNDPQPALPVSLKVRESGLYRVTAAQLAAAGSDFTGVPVGHMALQNLGEPVPLRVIADGPQVASETVFEFLGEALDTLYTDTNVYRLEIEPGIALRFPQDLRSPSPVAAAPTSFVEVHTVEHQREYSFASPTGDPWYEARVLANGQPAEAFFDLVLPGYAGGGGVSLEAEIWGGTDFPQAPDHHAVLEVNGELVDFEVFDGVTPRTLEGAVSADLAGDGTDRLRLHLPNDTGVPFDLIHFDRYRVTYPRSFEAVDGELVFRAAGEVFEVGGLPTDRIVVYRMDDSGAATYLPQVVVQGQGATFRARFAGSDEAATYLVKSVDSAGTPGLEPLRTPRRLLAGPTELLIISHPLFLEALTPLVDAREDQGWGVKVVDLLDVYAAYSGGVIDPEAIRSYIAEARRRLGTEAVLLVGGDSSDTRDYLGLGSISFLPTLYAATDELIRFAPVDPLYGDVDGDGIPEIPVGRFPVRTPEEAENLVAKTLAYETIGYSRTAVLAADGFDSAAGFSFSGVSEDLAARLPAGWQIERAYMQELGVSAAKDALVGAIEGGRALTSYVGHSGPTVWSFSGLLTAAEAAALDNPGRPTVVTQWGCWTTYHVSPQWETMGHRFLTPAGRGAAAVLGSTTLTTANGERALGERIFHYLGQPGMTLGRAIVSAKENLAAEGDPADFREVLLGWTLLGDPTLVMTP